jgi:putative phosphoesterase
MRIGVISDTHSQPIPPAVFKDFQKVDLIIHAGDFCSKEDFDLFSKIKDVKAVFGNMDDKSITGKLPSKEIVECEGVRIGITHGSGAREKVLEGVKKVFVKDNVRAVVFGHSHKALNETIDGVLYFNPGSPNDDVCALFCSYGILEVSKGKIKGKIIKVS